MKAIVCHEFGPLSSLCVEDVSDPTPQAGQVLIDVEEEGERKGTKEQEVSNN